jgi:hypothetical protein
VTVAGRSLMSRRLLPALALGVVSCAVASCSPTKPSDTEAPPQISSISPQVVSTTGGGRLEVRGSGFGAGTAVTVGGVVAPVEAGASATAMTVVLPTLLEGTASVIVARNQRTAGGQIQVRSPSGQNSAPVVRTIRLTGPLRAQPPLLVNVGDTITAEVTIVDDTPSDTTVDWRVPFGQIEGTGRVVRWTVPTTPPILLPSSVDITVSVTETYTEDGVEHRNRATDSHTASAHDSRLEITLLGNRFLDRFSQSGFTVDQVLEDFSTTCDGGGGRRAEARDVERDRRLFVRLPGYSITHSPPVTFDFGRSCTWTQFSDVRVRPADACAQYAVRWLVQYREDTFDDQLGVIPKGSTEESIGTDFVTAVYEGARWRLCHSDYQGTRRVTFPGSGIVLFGRVER